MKNLLVCVTFLITLTAPAFAQTDLVKARDGELSCFPERPGAWKPLGHSDEAVNFGLTAAQGKTLLANVHAFTNIIRTAPVFNPALGFNAEVWEDMCCPHECQIRKNCKTIPAWGRLWLRMHYFVAGTNGKPYTDDELYADLQTWFNNPYAVFNGDPVIRFADGREAARMPIEWREINGVMFYVNNDNAGTRWAFLKKNDRPLWIPVSREQLLKELIREREADLEKDFKGTNPMVLKGREMTVQMLIAPLKAELARMSPEERASQAWWTSGDPRNPLAPAGLKRARPVVILNPDYFDKSLPRTDIQLAVVSVDVPWEREPQAVAADIASGKIEHATDVGEARMWQLVTQLDWKKLATLVK